MTLTHADLVRRLRATHGYSMIEAQQAVHDVTCALTDLLDQLELGDRLTLKNLGHFECYLRKGGLRHGLHGRGPQILPDRPSLRFHANALRRDSLAARLGMLKDAQAMTPLEDPTPTNQPVSAGASPVFTNPTQQGATQ